MYLNTHFAFSSKMIASNFMLLYFISSVWAKSPPKIAVIGGGIGGTSCAYFLNQLFEKTTDITVYERDAIGGRLNTINIDGDHYESGGSVIHPKNKYMMDFAKLLGLGTRRHQSAGYGIYNGKQFTFTESDWFIVTALRYVWRYGLSFFEMVKLLKATLKDFSSIYELQDKELAFTTVSGMLEYMSPDFRNMTQESILSYMTKRGFQALFIEEVVQSIMMVNYGQTNNMSAFAGLVSLAGADSNLRSVEGGNKLVPEGLLKESKASIINGDVLEIILQSDGTYSLKYNESSSNPKINSKTYDIIVLANPLIQASNNIKFINFKKSFHQYESSFHRTVATFVKGDINPLFFNQDTVPSDILTFKNTLLFNSISQVKHVDDTKTEKGNKVYKVFSQQPLTSTSINSLFKNVELVKTKDWLAYPHYQPSENLPPFILYPGLYYINAIELAAGAMEMSAVAGKNVALLAFNLWNNMIYKVDNHKRVVDNRRPNLFEL